MRDLFTMGPLKTSTTRDGDTKISFSLETLVGPGMREAICNKLEQMAFKQVVAKIELVQGTINGITGEVV
jgi:hypothetical protein